MSLLNFTFPLFRLRTHLETWEENNIIYILNSKGEEKIIDNKNLLGKTIGMRRLKINKENLYPLNKVVFTFAQLLKTHKSGDKYVDNHGRLFTYRKTTRVPLKYYKVIKRTYIDGIGVKLDLEGLDKAFVVAAGYHNNNYIGLLHIHRGYLLYDFSDTKLGDTWRKV